MSVNPQALTLDTQMSPDARYKSSEFSFPIGVRIANAMLSSYTDRPLVIEELINEAKESTGLSDFGTEFWREPMALALKDINENTNFHPLGAFLYRKKVVQNLVNRLWAQYWIKEDNSIKKDLPPAVLITGLQRTGTTFLQRLLGALPEFRGVISWEIVNPVPTSKKKTYHGKKLAWVGHKALNYINPEFKAIHALNHDSLDEEVALMEHCFMSSILEAIFDTPNYSRWLEEQDQKPAYEDLKMWLQLLNWRMPAKHHFLLKSPHHMEYLDDFSTVFPNTRIIHMHRDPVETMASYCSMMHYSKKMFQPSSKPYEIGQHWLRKNKRLVKYCQAYKDENQDQFVDVKYKDLVKDPILTAQNIYKELGLTWSDEHTQLAKAYCIEHKKNKYGKHVYNLEDYGLNDRIIKDAFSSYYEQYEDYL